MRFGIALDLWAKESPDQTATNAKTNEEFELLVEMIQATGSLPEIVKLKENISIRVDKLTDDQKRSLRLIYNTQKAKFE
jgi:hypothetical protein